MHGPASLWIIEAFVAATAVAAALAGFVIAAIVLLARRLEPPVNRRRRRAVKWGLVLSLLPLGWLLLGDGLFLWDEFLTGSSWPVRMLVTGLSGLGIGCSAGLVFGYLSARTRSAQRTDDPAPEGNDTWRYLNHNQAILTRYLAKRANIEPRAHI